MLHAGVTGGLEVRATADGGAVVSGRFPYGVETQLGRGRREQFAAEAFELGESVYMLAQHDVQRPLASRQSGSLTLTNTADALTFEARIAPGVADTSHGKDTLAMIRSGLVAGLSPGFTVAADGETVERRGDDLIRTVTRATLAELSVVTVPAYSQAQVEARCWQPDNEPLIRFLDMSPTWRWR